MSENKFQKLYQQLNTEQKRAVDTIEGPVMVVAGPGTGKTQVLTMRVANILHTTDTNPQNILALTFTESGVNAMRTRLVEMIGSTGYYVNIFTFHSFCNDVIRAYPEEFDHFLGERNITEVEQIELLEDIVSKSKLNLLKPFGETFLYVRDIKKAISDLKKEAISPLAFKKIVAEEDTAFQRIEDRYYEKGAYKGKMKGKYRDQQKNIEKNKELARIYAAYQKKLKEEKKYDYDDMILHVVAQLEKNGDLLLRLQEQYQYLLVDEHQDTNHAQNKVVELLGNFYGENPNIFVVGDEKQAIFRFQGASLENFLYFKKRYPHARLIALTKNYRSTQSILDASHSFIEHNVHTLRQVFQNLATKLHSVTTHKNKKVEVFTFPSPVQEQYFLGKKIKELLSYKENNSSIAVLYRENADSLPFAEMLEKMEVPFVIHSSKNILRDVDIQKLLIIFELLSTMARPVETERSAEPDVGVGVTRAVFRVLHIDFFQIPARDIYILGRYLERRKLSLLELIGSKRILGELDLESSDRIYEIYSMVNRWYKYLFNKGVTELFEAIVKESGFLQYLLAKPNASEALNRLNLLFGELKKIISTHHTYSLLDFMRYLQLLETHNILIRERIAPSRNAVNLMTAHGAKGLEFDYVFIVNAYDTHWGNKRIMRRIKLPSQILGTNPSIDPNEDERRLFYVALTRARKEVFISYASTSEDGRKRVISQFVEEIKKSLREKGDALSYVREINKQKEILFAPRRAQALDIKDKEYLRELFLQRGFSATALNNYLTCPWQYFYRNLLRIPEAKNKHMMYGSAVHYALKRYFDLSKNGMVPKEFLLRQFSLALKKEPIAASDLDQALERGIKALAAYYENYHTNWITNTLNEFRIQGVKLGDDLRLTGALDKIEFLENKVNVVDYKTGSVKSRAFIEGKTKNANGNYKRQLVFYKLLLDNYPNLDFEMKTGEIDFVEPNPNGKFKKEKFDIGREEVKELERTVWRVANEILNLKFWDKKCGDKECKYCKLREVM